MKKYTAKLLPLAKQDISHVAQWYNDKQKGLGKKFTTQIRNEVTFIMKHPEASAVRYDDVRVRLTKTFPYMIHYKINHTEKIIIIIAVFGVRENPEKWHSR